MMIINDSFRWSMHFFQWIDMIFIGNYSINSFHHELRNTFWRMKRECVLRDVMIGGSSSRNSDQILIESLNQFFRTYSIVPQIKISPIFLHNDLRHSHQVNFRRRFFFLFFVFKSCNRALKAEEEKSIKYLLALAYIPQKDVINTFETLQEICLSTVQGE